MQGYGWANGWGQVSVLAWCYTSVEIPGLPWLNTMPPTPGTEVNFCSWGTAVSHKSDANPNSKHSAKQYRTQVWH
jgi:hypothetical protein